MSVVSAEVEQTNEVNWFGSLTHSLGLFTSAGQSRQCSVNPDKVLENVAKGTILTWDNLKQYCGSQPAILLNVFDTSWTYKGEYNMFSGKQIQINTQANRNVQIYCCPYKPCSTNAECSSPPASNYGNTCQAYKDSNGNPNGACYESSSPTHTTKVYKCVNDVWTFQRNEPMSGTAYCSDESQSNYLNSATTGSCLSTAPATCGSSNVPPTSLKEIGQSCSNDVECKTTHCNRNHRYSINQVCQPTPWDEVYRVSFTREQIGEATTEELIGIACVDGKHCLNPSENYTSKCISLNKLKDDGTLEIGTKTFFDTTHSLINRGAVGGILGGLACAGGIAGAIITAPTLAGSVVFGAVATSACTTLIAGGAILGANTAIGADNKNVIVEALNAEDADAVGLCVAEPKTSSVLNIFKFLAFFDVDGNGKKDGTDGLIILIIIFGLIMFLK